MGSDGFHICRFGRDVRWLDMDGRGLFAMACILILDRREPVPVAKGDERGNEDGPRLDD